jgi:DNA-binding winged helix-turn-helix (wHTH) protein
MRLRFDNCELDSEERVLRVEGRPVRLSPKAFDLLCLLAESRPKALAKQTLIDRVWPDAIVSDGSLAVLVAELRAALKDSSTTPRILRTVPRFGYAFCAQLTDTADVAAKTPALAWLLNRSERIALPAGVITLGRDPTCEAMIDAPGVSRRHAQIRVEATGIVIEDLGSKNGTFLNDNPVLGPTTMGDGDRVRFGPIQYLLRVAGIDTLTRL